MKKYKSINLKRIMPGLVSVFIIAGMAIQSFATNVDMAAFVKKDKYMTKYYELDWRIDDIEKELERLYKFTCTNVRSYGGSGYKGYTNRQPGIFYQMNTTNTYEWYVQPIADLSQEGYLRWNYPHVISHFGNHAKTDTFVREVPATLCRWRDGIELTPTTKLKITYTRTYASGVSTAPQSTLVETLVMGPFKKFPHISGTGNPSGFVFASDVLPTNGVLYNDIKYAYGSETEPTSWTTMSAGVLNEAYYPKTSTYLPESVRGGFDYQDLENNAYNDRAKGNPYITVRCVSTVFGTDLSSRTNVWLRCTRTSTTEYSFRAGTADFTITSWNYNK